MWRDEQHRAFKLHTHFELLKGVPVRMDLTAANTNERQVLKSCLQPDRVYVIDRGYVEFALFQQILAAGSSFVCRMPDSTVFEVLQERELSQAALVHRPKVLFADEPTGNLDAAAGAELMALLKDLHGEGQTIVLVTHDPGIAAQADRSMRLEAGVLRQV